MTIMAYPVTLCSVGNADEGLDAIVRTGLVASRAITSTPLCNNDVQCCRAATSQGRRMSLMVMTAMASMTMLEVSSFVSFFVELLLSTRSQADSQLPGLQACVLKCLVRLHALCLHVVARQLSRECHVVDKMVALCQNSLPGLQLVLGR